MRNAVLRESALSARRLEEHAAQRAGRIAQCGIGRIKPTSRTGIIDHAVLRIGRRQRAVLDEQRIRIAACRIARVDLRRVADAGLRPVGVEVELPAVSYTHLTLPTIYSV